MLILFCSIVTTLLLLSLAQDYLRLRTAPHLTTPSSVCAALPLVSILIPARNEARNIAACLDGVLAQQYGSYEVIVVDDGSTDATPAILARYAKRYPHLVVIRSAELPPGWMGKAHACQQAAAAARGEWLLFLDADTVARPTLVRALLHHAEQHGYAMLTIFPFLVLGSFWERVILPPFRAIIHATFPFARLNDPAARPEEVIANGQCILIQRAAYEQVGGHTAVRQAVLEDVCLAQLVRAAGFRLGAAYGGGQLQVRMYTNGCEVREGLLKNAAAGYRSGGMHATWAGLHQFFLVLGPQWLLGGGTALLLNNQGMVAWVVLAQAGLVWLVALSFWALQLRQLYGLPWYDALWWPFGMVCYGMIVLHSIWQVQSGRGVHWKGRNYAGT